MDVIGLNDFVWRTELTYQTALPLRKCFLNDKQNLIISLLLIVWSV